jgi:hypothetical protein
MSTLNNRMPKISQIPSATLPIIGNEVAIINQNGSTYSSVLSNFIGRGSDVSTLSANWQNTYTTFSSNSANYAKVNVNNNFSSTQTFTTSSINVGGFPLSATVGGNSLFGGNRAGNGATCACFSNFLGYNAGNGATFTNNSNFFGSNAGNGATNASNSNFFGRCSGNGATNASNSNFFGNRAGYCATCASNSNFLGYNAGNGATNACHSIFIGYNAGNGASLSASIALGSCAIPTSHNQLVLGSSAYPLSTVNSGNCLVVNINGTMKKIALLSV